MLKTKSILALTALAVLSASASDGMNCKICQRVEAHMYFVHRKTMSAYYNTCLNVGYSPEECDFIGQFNACTKACGRRFHPFEMEEELAEVDDEADVEAAEAAEAAAEELTEDFELDTPTLTSETLLRKLRKIQHIRDMSQRNVYIRDMSYRNKNKVDVEAAEVAEADVEEIAEEFELDTPTLVSETLLRKLRKIKRIRDMSQRNLHIRPVKTFAYNLEKEVATTDDEVSLQDRIRMLKEKINKLRNKKKWPCTRTARRRRAHHLRSAEAALKHALAELELEKGIEK